MIDDISNSSELAIDEPEKPATVKPAFIFEAFSEETTGTATVDCKRMTTAKEFCQNLKVLKKPAA